MKLLRLSVLALALVLAAGCSRGLPTGPQGAAVGEGTGFGGGGTR